MIVCVGGMYCSGKDTFAEYLVSRGFKHISLSDILRGIMNKRGIEITRDNLIATGDSLRAEHGHGILAELALNKIAGKKGDFVVTSIRHTAEAKALLQQEHSFMVEVFAPIEERFRRIKKRKRENDPKTLAELKKKEAYESQEEGPHMQLHKVMKMAQYVLKSDCPKEQGYRKADRLLADLYKRVAKAEMRKSWTDKLMV